MLIKQLTAFFLSFVLIFISTPSFAVYDPNAKHSKWFHDSIVNDPLNKSSVDIKAQRTYPVSTLGPDGKPIIQNKPQKSTIKLGASASNVGKGLVRRTPAVAITYAVTALLGKAVDWVMDAENNRIKYKDGDDASGGEGSTSCAANSLLGPDKKTISQVIAEKRLAYKGPGVYGKDLQSTRITCANNTVTILYKTKWCEVACEPSIKYPYGQQNMQETVDYPVTGTNPSSGGGSPSDQYKYIPISDVAQKVIDNADAGHAPSMEVMNNTALDMLEAGLLDAQLEAAAEPKQFGQGETDPTDPNQTPTDPENPTDPETPTDPESKPFELPPFCSWATKVCSFIDWMQAEPPNDTEIELPEPDAQDVDTDIDFGGQCPDDAGFTMNIFGNDVEFVMMPFSKFCPLLDTYIKPVLVVLGSFMAVTIVGGRRDA